MNLNMVIKNAWICPIGEDRVEPLFGHLEIRNGRIKRILAEGGSEVETAVDLLQFDAGGRVITAPLVNFHDHFYSRLAKGLPISGPMDSFTNILASLWWKLDRLLDGDMIRASALMAAAEAVRNGVTCIFDHHASPLSPAGSLAIIAGVLRDWNLRGVLCFETSDRNGKLNSRKALKENQRFISEQSDDQVKGMMGLHASFTVDDDTLERAAEIVRETGAGIHIHLCESVSDRDESLSRYGKPPLERLELYGLLNDRSILAHSIHLSDQDFEVLAKHGCSIAYNVDSNLNNGVGLARFGKIPLKVPRLAGTDGMHGNIARSQKQIFLLARHSGLSFDKAFQWFAHLYFQQFRMVRKFFPDFPRLAAGDRADLIIWDYVPPTPLLADNFFGHYIYGMLERPVRDVLANGSFLMKHFKLCRSDEAEVDRIISEQGQRLYEKFSE